MAATILRMPAASRRSRLSFALLLAAALRDSYATAADSFDLARDLIRRKLNERAAPSIAVAVAHNGRIVWEEAFGWADVEAKRPATEHTSYKLGSVSKPITATAVMVACERGLLHLDRPINDYLGDVKIRAKMGDASAATVRRVLQHVSGLPEHGEAYYKDEPGSLPPLDTVLRRYAILTRPPGEKFVYSNLGYAALSRALETVASKPFDDFLHDELFGPLGMNHSAAPGRHLPTDRAAGYREDGTREVEHARTIVSAADLYASAHDLARFGLFHLKSPLGDERRILSNRTIDEMQQATVAMGDAEYGLGWHIRKDAMGRRQVLHGGASAGVDVQFTLIPTERVCVAVLANGTRHYPGAVTEAVTNAILAALLGGSPDDFPILKPSPPKPSELPGKLDGRWVGTVQTHQGDHDLTVWCERNGDVSAQLDRQSKVKLRDPRLVGTALTGKMDGDIGTDDARRRPYELDFDLTLRGDVLCGTVYATSLPSTQRPLRLGYWVELRRATER